MAQAGWTPGSASTSAPGWTPGPAPLARPAMTGAWVTDTSTGKRTWYPTNPADTATTEQYLPAGPEGSALERGATELYQKSPLAPAVGLVKGAANVAAHPLDTYFGLVPLADTGKELLKAQWNQAVQAAQKAKEATRRGSVLSASEALGHGLAAILPLLGPAAADVGEHFAKGDIAGGVGGTVGLLAPFAAKYGLELKNAPDAGKADLLRREAEQQVSEKVLAPGAAKYRGTAQKIAPEILSRGLQGDRFQLQQLADEGMMKAGEAIDAVIDSRPPETNVIPVKPITDAITARIDRYVVNGQVIPTAASKVQQLEALNKYLNKQGPELSFTALKQIRDDFYRAADESKGYQLSGNQAIADAGWAAREAGSAIRETIAAERPELMQPNADYTFFKRLNDVLDPTLGRPKTSTSGTPSIPGAIAGATVGAAAHASGIGAVMGALLPKLRAFTQSPKWQLARAADKMKLADAIEAGQIGSALKLITWMSQLAPRTPAPAPPQSSSEP